MRGRLCHKGCIVRLTVAASQQGSHNLCELVCHKVIALMIAERKRNVAMEKSQACDGHRQDGTIAKANSPHHLLPLYPLKSLTNIQWWKEAEYYETLHIRDLSGNLFRLVPPS